VPNLPLPLRKMLYIHEKVVCKDYYILSGVRSYILSYAKIELKGRLHLIFAGKRGPEGDLCRMVSMEIRMDYARTANTAIKKALLFGDYRHHGSGNMLFHPCLGRTAQRDGVECVHTIS